MTIEPLMINPKMRYYVATTFRSPERENVIDFTRELQAKIPNVVSSLEGMSRHA